MPLNLPYPSTLRHIQRSCRRLITNFYTYRYHTTSCTNTVGTRFAPSPTGDLHIGGLRTALYNYLYAKHNHGKYILRIEDTDQKRTVMNSVDQLINILLQCNVQHDNHNELYYQSDRLPIYHKYIDVLFQSGAVYPCFCSSDRLAESRQQQIKSGIQPQYDRLCSKIPHQQALQQLSEYKATNQPYVYRLRVPHTHGHIVVNDLCRGKIQYPYKQIDDQILIKSDGYPTYHFAVVVDDYLLNITHIIRGEEWLTSTPKHIILYNAFQWNVPQYCHLPLLLNKDGTKLSKRNSDVSAMSYLNKGYLPEALINFIVFLGWNTNNNNELLSIQDMIKLFDIRRIQKGGAVVDIKKLNWFNQQYIRKLVTDDINRILSITRPLFQSTYPNNILCSDDKFLIRVIQCLKEHVTLTTEFVTESDYLFGGMNYSTDESMKMHTAVFSDQFTVRPLTIVQNTMNRLNELSDEQSTDVNTISELLTTTQTQLGITSKQYFMTLRYILTARHTGPHLNSILATLGKQNSITRLQTFIVQQN